MAQILQSSTYSRSFLMVYSSDHLTGATSVGPRVYLSKAGTQAFSLASGSSIQIPIAGGTSGGMYSITLSPGDTNTLGDLAYLCVGTNCDPTNFIDQITAWNPSSNSFVAGTMAQPVTVSSGTVSQVVSLLGGTISNIAAGTYNASINITGGTQTYNIAGTLSNAVGSFSLAGGTYAINIGGSVNNIIQSVVAGTIAQNPLLVAGGTIGLVNLTTTATSVTNTVGLTGGTYAVNLGGSVNNVIQATTTTITGGTVSGVTNPVTLASGVNVTQWAGGTVPAVVNTGEPIVTLAAGTYAVNLSGSVNSLVNNPTVTIGSVNVSQWAGGTISPSTSAGIPYTIVVGGTVSNVTNSIVAGTIAQTPLLVTGGTIGSVSGNVGGSVASVTGSVNSVTTPVSLAGGTYAVNFGGSINNVIQGQAVAIGSVNVSQWAGGTINASTVAGVPYTIVIGGTTNNLTSSIVAGTIAQNPLLISGGTIGIVSGSVGSVSGNVGGSISGSVNSVIIPVSLAAGTYAVNFGGSINNVVNLQQVGSVNVSQWAGGTITQSTSSGVPYVFVLGGTVANVTNPVSITGGTISAVTGAVGSVTGAVGSVTGAVGSVTAPVSLAAGTYAVNLGGSVNTIINPVIVSGGTVNISTQQLYVKENAALNGFMFLMVSSTDHVTPATGLTITSQVSINGGAFNNTANSATEISNGVYTINLTAADTNGHTLMFLFSASGADNRYIEVVTQA